MVFVIGCSETAPVNIDAADVIDLHKQLNFT